MRSTFIKLFLAFWITEALIFVFTLMILVNQFRTTEAVYTSAFAQMESNARLSIKAYESGGCAALRAVPSVFPIDVPAPGDQPALLFDPQDHLLCQPISPAPYARRVADVRKYGYMVHNQNSQSYMQGVLADDPDGHHFVYILRGSYPRDIYIPYREMLPRLLISLIVSLAVTFVITLMITRPIGLLRTAARQLSEGNLRARVAWPRRGINRSEKDELRGLVWDFNHMAERLESLVDAQKLLLRDVSHELRSPLARLSVALELAREEAAAGALAAAENPSSTQTAACSQLIGQLDRIERESLRLNELIGQLLNLSHLESTRRLPDPQPIALRELLLALLPDMEYEASRRHCNVVFEQADETPDHTGTTVLGNRELLARALENVVRNAIAYTAEGTTVSLTLRTEDRLTGELVVVAVADHGPGVPRDQLQSIFRPFHRLDDARQRTTGGYGVGLAITERAVRLHGGEVAAHNAPHGGLVVEIRLPVATNA